MPRDWKPAENDYLKHKSIFDSYHRTWQRQGTSSQAKMPFGTILGCSQAWLIAECTLWTVSTKRLTTVLKREHRKNVGDVGYYCLPHE